MKNYCKKPRTPWKGDAEVNTLKAGFARVNITPMMGIGIRGYFKVRIADGVLDELEINALALSDGKKKAVLLSLDNCGFNTETMNWYRAGIAEKTGLPVDAIFISCTHTHTGPFIMMKQDEHHGMPGDDALILEYSQWVRRRAVDAAVFALEDLKDARMGFGIGCAPRVAFIRRYIMKNGEIRTNPGVNNPEVDRPCGEADERVNIVRFDREGAQTIVLVNFGNHPDVVGGNKISADWPGFLRRGVEKSLDNVRCVFFNGAQGDVNHVNVFPKDGDLNDLFMDFDDVSRGYGHARHIGNVLTGAVLQVFDKVAYRDVDGIRYLGRMISVPSNMPAPEDMPRARRINELHQAGRDDEIPYKAMMLTTVVAEAERMIHLEHGPNHFDMPLSGLAVGDIALIGLPGEPFTGIGLGLKQSPDWAAVLPCCLTNGGEGYFPMMDAYEEGGYEARSSRFRAGTAEKIVEEGLLLLKELKNR